MSLLCKAEKKTRFLICGCNFVLQTELVLLQGNVGVLLQLDFQVSVDQQFLGLVRVFTQQPLVSWNILYFFSPSFSEVPKKVQKANVLCVLILYRFLRISLKMAH